MNLAILNDKQTAVTPFSFDDFAIRALTIDGEPWFVAADVCDALGLENTSQAVKGRADRGNQDGLDSEEQGVATVTTPSGDQQMLVVNESGLYSLTFKSRKPEAKRFKRWVTSEVLPSIRKTGSYSVQAPAFALPDFANPASAARAWAIQYEAAQTLAIERDHAIKTKAQIGDKRQATSMAKVAVANREVAKLKDQLGFSARHATILQVEEALGGEFHFLPLRNWCKHGAVTPEVVPDKRYPNGVKAWPAGAWLAVYGVDLVELFGEVA